MIVEVEGEHADHLTTTTVLKVVWAFLKLPKSGIVVAQLEEWLLQTPNVLIKTTLSYVCKTP